MYIINKDRPDITLNVVHTFRYEAEEASDPRNDTMCVELESPDKRYHLICSSEEFANLKPAD